MARARLATPIHLGSLRLHVWMAPAVQEVIWRVVQLSLAVMCPAC
jgi:hypothetical protein